MNARAAIDRFTNAVSVRFNCVLFRFSKREWKKQKQQLKYSENVFFFFLYRLNQSNQTTKNTLSELEKREKRAMERKISEMEEELKVNIILTQMPSNASIPDTASDIVISIAIMC